MPETKLHVFLCHASQDKPIVRELYQRLLAEGWIDPWLDEEKLLPGQDWDMEIEKAVENADAVIVCLSQKSVNKDGYVQRELKFVVDIALEKPEEKIFIIPLRLDDVQPPRRLRSWQYVDYFPEKQKRWAFAQLIKSLRTQKEMVDGNAVNDTYQEKIQPIGIIDAKPESKVSDFVQSAPDFRSQQGTGVKKANTKWWSLLLDIFGVSVSILTFLELLESSIAPDYMARVARASQIYCLMPFLALFEIYEGIKLFNEWRLTGKIKSKLSFVVLLLTTLSFALIGLYFLFVYPE